MYVNIWAFQFVYLLAKEKQLDTLIKMPIRTLGEGSSGNCKAWVRFISVSFWLNVYLCLFDLEPKKSKKQNSRLRLQVVIIHLVTLESARKQEKDKERGDWSGEKRESESSQPGSQAVNANVKAISQKPVGKINNDAKTMPTAKEEGAGGEKKE